MALKALKCPNCDANIQVDDDREYGFCDYCGAEIQTQDVIEVRHVTMHGSFEKMLSDGEVYYKLEDYYRAERKFREVIKHYPQQRVGYEGLIRTLTREETVYPLTHEKELFRLLYELEQLASAEEKEAFDERRKKMHEGFDAEHAKVAQAQRAREIDKERYARTERMIYSICIFMAVFIVAISMVIEDVTPPIEFSVFLVAFVGITYWLIWRKNP